MPVVSLDFTDEQAARIKAAFEVIEGDQNGPATLTNAEVLILYKNWIWRMTKSQVITIEKEAAEAAYLASITDLGNVT